MKGVTIFVLIFQLVVGSHAFAQMPRQVEMFSDYMEQAQDIANGAYRLIGNVRFDHQGASMYCDSAYFYGSLNSLEAFSRVHLVQGDTMDLYGEFLAL